MDPREAPFPEDFLTNSDIHVSKLSDEEFRRKRRYLLDHIQQNCQWAEEECRKPHITKRWDHDVADQFRLVIIRRDGYTLPLPEPVELKNLQFNDLMGVFSKMHPRAFSRSFRLSKAVDNLLRSNCTKFNVRIPFGQLGKDYSNDGHEQLTFSRRCCSGSFPIHDALSIFPFTFDRPTFDWHGDVLFNWMKWPFLNASYMNLRYGVIQKPWMNGRSWDFDIEAPPQNWNLARKMNPKEVRVFDDVQVPLPELLNSAEHLHFSGSGYHENVFNEIEKWRSGHWNYKATTISGTGLTEDLIALERFSYCIQNDMSGVLVMSFIPNPKNVYLVLTAQFSRSHYSRYHIYTNITSLTDLIPHHNDYYFPCPLDYSCYEGDPDAVLVPKAFTKLLSAYISQGDIAL